MSDTPSLWKTIRPLVFAGWVIAAIRFGLDAGEVSAARYFGVYYLMPIVLIAFALQKRFDHLRFLRLLLAMFVIGALVWGVPNVITYTTAQFLGWEHGRFGADGGITLQEGTGAKFATGLMSGFGTSIAGTVWMTAFAFVSAWIPGALRRREAANAAAA